MRLHRLRLQAFLTFPGTETIDFDRLGQSGLFLLQGRTGAGKTSVLDAIAFALYGEVPGGREGGARLRSDHADPGVLTEVELELTLRGRRVRVSRRPEQERPKQRGTGVTREAHSVRVFEIREDGTELTLAARHDEARAELGDLLGMTCEQFCQVVMLPQGGFAKFLHAGSDKREELLRDLFDVGRFLEAERWLKDRHHDAVRSYTAALGRVRDLMSRASQAADAQAPEDWESEPSLAAEWVDRQLVLADASQATAQQAAEESAQAADAAATELTAAERLAALQREHDEARQALLDWEAGRPRYEAVAAELAAARRAAAVRSCLETLTEAEASAAQAADLAEEGLRVARAAHPGAIGDPAALRALAATCREDSARASARLDLERSVEQEQQALAELERQVGKRGSQRDGLEERISVGEARRAELANQVESAVRALTRVHGLEGETELARQRAEAALRRDRLQVALAAAGEALLSAREQAVAAQERALRLGAARLEGMAAVLSAELEHGAPCPVCGSCEHPEPAGQPEDGVPSEQELTAAREQAERLGRVRDERQEERQQIGNELAAAVALAGEEGAVSLGERSEALEEELARCRSVGAALSGLREELVRVEQELLTWTAERDDAASSLAALQESLRLQSAAASEKRRAVEAARAGAASISARVACLDAATDALEAAAGLLDNLQRRRAEVERRRRRAQDEAADAGFEDLAALRAAMRDATRCDELERELQESQSELVRRQGAAARPELTAAAATPAPDLAGLQAAHGARRAQAEAAHAECGRAAERVGALRRLQGELAQAVDDAVPSLERLQLVREVAELANGTSASNRLRMRLSAYVLAARLEEVAAAATLRLQRMSAGRYSLVHADDGARGNRRGGLDLRVLDSWTGRERTPASLSGGETFMASLALALGLADVVTAAAGASALETLFIDEGFGSLDDEGTLEEVMNVLDSLREGGRVVGVVSHVGAMRERIPTQLRIETGTSGSTVLAPV